MHAPSESAAFDEASFESRLESLKDTQDGIQLMSAWCLQHRSHHRRIVSCWLNVFKRARVEHRLVLFYLANDVIQHSKRKRYDFVDSWATALQRATTMVRDDKVKSKILRIFGIWEQRDIFSEDYLNDLRGLLNSAPPAKRPHSSSSASTSNSSTAATSSTAKGSADTLAAAADEFQASTLMTHVRECVQLSEATDRSFRKLPKAPPYDLDNVQSVKAYLKDKTHSEEVKSEFERHSSYLETYTQSLKAEIRSRKLVMGQLERAIKFYGVQRGEVKVIVNAYKNFGARIKMVKKKLDEIAPSLPSPIPSPDVNAPSPEPDADLALPDDQAPDLSMVFGQMNGFTGYLGSTGKGMLPFDINDFKSSSSGRSSSHPIEVIGSRSDDESYAPGSSGGDYYKPEPLSPFPRSSTSGTPLIPGLSPMPVPPVNDGYSSLARSSQQYAGILPPPQSAPLFSSPYTPAVGSSVGYQPQPIMPPPPMPPLGLDVGGGGRQSNSSDDYNSSWTDMSMPWTQLNTSGGSTGAGGYASGVTAGGGAGVPAAETPVSPPHFERESSTAGGPLEYREHPGAGMGSSAEDVDHRQLGQRPPFSIGSKLGLSKDKSRQLDIRNLISLTDSPGANDSEKNVSWLSVQSVDFRSNHTGDVDYRSSASVLRTIETTHKGNATSSPLKTPDSHKDMDSSVRAVAKSNDMVVDMDMSDEDVDELYRDQSVTDVSGTSLDGGGVKAPGGAVDPHTRPPLLDTPHEYDTAAGWPDMAAQQQQQPVVGQQQAQLAPWSGPPPGIWNGGGGGAPGGVGPSGNGTNGLSVPPPPVVPQFAPYPPYAGGGEFNSPRPMGRGGGGGGGGRGRGGGWAGGPPGGGSHRGGNPFAGPRLNFNRGYRGGGIGGGGGAPSPGGGMRGNYRGKFRGHSNNAWI